MAKTLIQRILDTQDWLDEVADRVQPVVNAVISKGGTQLANAVDGKWLGTPLHPPLTDVPIGTWTAAACFDTIDAAADSEPLRNAADASLAFGTLAAGAAAATGWAEFRYLKGADRRVAIAHALMNGTAIALNAGSLALRATGRRDLGRSASLLAFGISGVAGHVGGELAYDLGVGVNRTAFDSAPKEFESVLDERDLEGDAMRAVDVGGTSVLITRGAGGGICAIADSCSHMGGSLAGGSRQGDVVQCPLHGSRFDLRSGGVVDGPASSPQPRYETRVREGRVEVRGIGE